MTQIQQERLLIAYFRSMNEAGKSFLLNVAQVATNNPGYSGKAQIVETRQKDA